MPAPALKVPESSAPAEWEAYAGQRGCYCGIWSGDPKRLEERGLPRGFCGECQRCGKHGHARHFPGPLPITGAWCDRCYRITRITWRLRTPFGLAAIALAIWWSIETVVRAL